MRHRVDVCRGQPPLGKYGVTSRFSRSTVYEVRELSPAQFCSPLQGTLVLCADPGFPGQQIPVILRKPAFAAIDASDGLFRRRLRVRRPVDPRATDVQLSPKGKGKRKEGKPFNFPSDFVALAICLRGAEMVPAASSPL